ncbi:peptidoglycan DD-metalloendopeptidase family protein [Acanthopleuribacter pedis]|uniref:Peptidoglycan DD-metalloendopeptidase family protein n=1 Tax=Acanthopleuribacter pedis TaxID=442870 RepID=A0A8J7QCL0_9BACT|nr:peptidoglycan DD-metalloendopeptidase family protein [Acanthopleuribacter pedis]
MPEPVPVVAVPVPVEPEVVDPRSLLTWKRGAFGRTLIYTQLQQQGVEGGDIHRIIDLLTPVYNFRKSHPEHMWEVGFHEDGRLAAFTLKVSPVEIYDINDLDTEAVLQRREIETFTETKTVRGTIDISLFGALAEEPQTAVLAGKLAKVFAWDIDFYKDPRQGDHFDMLVEAKYVRNDDGVHFLEYGEILAARYQGAFDTYDAFAFDAGDGELGYYNSEGKSLVREMMRSPLKLQRVTSRFNKNRFHPVLKRRRPHNGVDYGAPRNTPVMAVASGRVVRAGRYGGAGIAVEIKHRNKILTQYFHLNKIAKGVHVGSRVKQGEVIGYVGKTGYATGYHLHFGMKRNGRYVDPLAQKFPPSTPVPQELRGAFQTKVAHYLTQIDGVDNRNVLVRKAGDSAGEKTSQAD